MVMMQKLGAGSQPSQLPQDRPRTVPASAPRYEQCGDQRLAFQIDGPRITRVPVSRPIGPATREWWWLDDGAECSVTPARFGLHLEVTADLLNGTRQSVERVAKVMGLHSDGREFEFLYGRLFAMMQPQPEN